MQSAEGWNRRDTVLSEQKAQTAMMGTTGFSHQRPPLMSSTGPNFFQQTNQGFGVTNLEGLDSDQLKERLLVAETIMKKLYTRNKELEEYH